MLHKEYSLFESVIHITEDRDKRSLEKSLIETLSDFIDYDALFLLRVPRRLDCEYLEVAVARPTIICDKKLKVMPHDFGDPRVFLDDQTRECIKNRETISGQGNHKRRILIPITVNNKVAAILDIYGHDLNKHSEKLIRGFSRIYRNFMAVINDNEHDTLTGLLNRKTFDTQVNTLLSHPLCTKDSKSAKGKNRRIANKDAYHWVAMLDIDHFKSINDNFGHVYGDEVLLLLSDLMKKSFRSNDLLFRYGGEEFVIILEPATKEDAHLAFERFRQNLAQFEFPRIGHVSISTGIVRIDTQEHPATVLEHADQALYYAKENGRNRVCNYHDLIEEGALSPRQVESDIELFG